MFKLTECGFEIQQGNGKIIDIAIKYGYESQSAFTRAFKAFHGITPANAKDMSAVLNVQERMIFQLHDFYVKRGDTMGILGKVDFMNL